MNPERFKSFLEKQKIEMEKFKWDLGVKKGCDPGQEAVHEWIQKYAKKFRKDFALGDLKEALNELRELRSYIQDYLNKIAALNSIINKCEDKMIEGIELIETENGDK